VFPFPKLFDEQRRQSHIRKAVLETGMTDTPFKAQAQRLADYLSRVHGVKLKHASLLEAIAQVHGRADWNTLLACGSTDFPAVSTAVPPAGVASGVPPLDARPQVSLLTHLLETALAQGSETLDLYVHDAGVDAFVRVDGVSRQTFSGTSQDYLKLVDGLRAAVGTSLPSDISSELGQYKLIHPSAETGQVEVDVTLKPRLTSASSRVSLRWKHPRREPRELSALGLSSVAEWRRALSHQRGVLVVGGPTGTGKTTTVVATARELARQGRRVFIQDSDIREGDVPGAIHGPASREVGDVVVVDLRNSENVRAAFDLAHKGALVLATLHTTTLVRALARIFDAGVSREEQEGLLRGLVVQQLLPRVCKACEAKGCDACVRGVTGRVLIAECVSPRSDATIYQRLFGEGCDVVPMVEDAVEYCRLGVITPQNLAQQFGDDARWRLAVRPSQDIA
jgi:general secretion pathway protein E